MKRCSRALAERDAHRDVGEADQIAATHLYLMENRFVTGTVLTVNGGSVLDRKLARWAHRTTVGTSGRGGHGGGARRRWRSAVAPPSMARAAPVMKAASSAGRRG